MLSRRSWERDIQKFEATWWGDCCNTYGEETKQLAYAKVMGLEPGPWRGGVHWPVWDFAGLSVLDVGGGPSSMLLKSRFDRGVVVDPCTYPLWVAERYAVHGVEYHREPAEDDLSTFADNEFDVALIYNCLEHTLDPERITRQMARVARRVHIFEWVEEPPHPGHPHELHADELAGWLGGNGDARHVWFDELYREIGASSKSPVRQHGWGGVFDTA